LDKDFNLFVHQRFSLLISNALLTCANALLASLRLSKTELQKRNRQPDGPANTLSILAVVFCWWQELQILLLHMNFPNTFLEGAGIV
jgi:hypothetical protein